MHEAQKRIDVWTEEEKVPGQERRVRRWREWKERWNVNHKVNQGKTSEKTMSVVRSPKGERLKKNEHVNK